MAKMVLSVATAAGAGIRTSSKHSARFHFEYSESHLQFMDGPSNFWVFTNFAPQRLQQMMSSSHMLCCLSRAGVRFGFALRLPDTHHLSDRILALASVGTHPRSHRRRSRLNRIITNGGRACWVCVP